MKFLPRLRALFRRNQLDADMAEEMRHHLEAQIQRNLASGMSPQEAHYAAQRSFGGIEQIKERCRDQRGAGWLDDLARDLLFGARVLRKSPGFTFVAIVTLALGIGANTTIFSRVDQLLVRPLPVDEPHQLALIAQQRRDGQVDFDAFSFPAFRDYQRASSAFSHLSAMGSMAVGLGSGGGIERQDALLVSGNYFALLGLNPALGRTFAANEGVELNDAPVVILSYHLWQRRFGADPQVLGRSVIINGQPFTVIGVMPREFSGTTRGRAPDLYLPLTQYGQLVPERPDGQNPLASRHFIWLRLLGRLNPNTTPVQAASMLNAIAAESRPAGSTRAPVQVTVLNGVQGFTGEVREERRPLQLLMVTSGLILLITCANLANLQLARASVRARDFAVRLALGAGRSRLVRQLLTESLLLALLGGGLGLLVATWLTHVLREFGLPSPAGAASTSFDLRVLGFTLLASVVTGILFGLAPAWRAGRAEVVPELKRTGSVDQRVGRWSLRGVLVVLQVALSLLVLVSAGLCVRSLKRLQQVDPGFAAAKVVLMSFDLGLAKASPQQAQMFYDQLLERARAFPGVEAASLAQSTPLSGSSGGMSLSRIEGYEAAPRERFSAAFEAVSSEYFRTLGVQILRGRDLQSTDTATSAKVVIVNDAFAKRYWPGQDPLGRRIFLPGPQGGTAIEVVGVVQSTRARRLTEEPRPTMFFPVTQQPAMNLTLAVRTALDPAGIVDALRAMAKSIDAQVPLVRVRTLAQQKADSLMLQRLVATLLSGFGFLALLLAALGLYGVLAYSVACRRREIGVRMALGAQIADVLGLVLRQGLGLVGVGMGLGFASAFAATRLLQSFLYDVTPLDPLTFAVVGGLLALVALIACWLPARSATKVDPMVALRAE